MWKVTYEQITNHYRMKYFLSTLVILFTILCGNHAFGQINYPQIDSLTLHDDMDLIAEDELVADSIAPQTKTKEKINFYRVKSNDTLYGIATEFGVSIDDIKRINPGLTETLRIGQTIMIPIYLSHKIDPLTNSISKEKDSVTTNTIRHITQSKETLYGLSKKYNIKVEDIIILNPELKKEGLRAGNVILIPKNEESINYLSVSDDNTEEIDELTNSVSTPIKTENSSSPSPDFKKINQQEPQLDSLPVRIYKVRLWERLKRISRREHIPLEVIYKLNPGVEQTNVRWRDRIFLPAKDVPIERYLQEKQDVSQELFENFFTIMVKENETLDDICEKYDITSKQIYLWNPSLPRTITSGLLIKIPLKYKLLEDDIETPTSQEKISTHNLCLEKQAQLIPTVYRIALMIPLDLNSLPTGETLHHQHKEDRKHPSRYNFIQYYEGILLALDTLQQQGITADFFVYDVGKNEHEAYNAIDENLKTMDLIIGPIYNAPFQIVAQFANDHQIKIINPLSNRTVILNDGSGVFKIQPTIYTELNSITEYIKDNFYDSTSIYIYRNNAFRLKQEEKFLIDELTKKIDFTTIENNNKLFSFDYINDTVTPIQNTFITPVIEEEQEELTINHDSEIDELHDFTALLESETIENEEEQTSEDQQIEEFEKLPEIPMHIILNRNNIIICLMDNEAEAIEFVRHINEYHDSIPGVMVIGLSQWQKYDLSSEMLQNLKTHIFDTKYIDYDADDVKCFVRKFREKFATEPDENKYAFIGYDVVTYFLTAMHTYGKDFEDCLSFHNPKLLQYQLLFQKNDTGNFENSAMFPLWYYKYQLLKKRSNRRGN